MKNLLTVTMLSLDDTDDSDGGRGPTRRGNNNAYCQDNDISWLSWTNITKHDVHRFNEASALIAGRRCAMPSTNGNA